MTAKIVGQIHSSLVRRSRGRPKLESDQEARIKVFQEARRLFLDRGYSHSTMDELAAQRGVSKKTLYQLFPSKRAVLGMIVDDGRHTIMRLPFEDDSASMMDALRHIFRVDVDDEVCFERIAMMRLCRQERSDTREVELTLMQEAYDAYARLFGNWVTRQIALGRMRAIDPEVATTIMFEMFYGGLFTQDGRLKHWDSKAERRRYMEECIRMFVDGTRAG
ncbi:hypothetical protein ASG19_14080 [Rhizobium sp. Leaf306]|uniref:TetR/AcrR family transcriptional regulator n=1 Tax=Rhizobium sp. Leaf306 TaxID=1736330 RepID=UPI000713ECAC|nr:TetR/AcrR family transcriptional regulator [Rhizobium sp. Leaf306]KQQ34888.1 hypothetical protein ASG19_14080 [Rhizobium sp. Leaf306]